ncbi:MAG TPA: molybdenum cofactor biosynthesis protein MoaE [Nitrososphaerales archaeon]|nr:molybdenum cofactor biosynthesis protein MoaE [Nitrososphaerales archaeon]
MPGKYIVSGPIDPTEAIQQVSDDSAGGIAVFIGTVRNINEGKRVRGLTYEVYGPMAEKNMGEIEAEVRKRWPVKKIRLVHRQGKLSVGEVSVVVAVSCEHRGEAFEACRYAIDRIKEKLPLWKQESDAGGRTRWVAGRPIES